MIGSPDSFCPAGLASSSSRIDIRLTSVAHLEGVRHIPFSVGRLVHEYSRMCTLVSPLNRQTTTQRPFPSSKRAISLGTLAPGSTRALTRIIFFLIGQGSSGFIFSTGGDITSGFPTA